MTREDEIKKIALCYAHDELKDNHGDVEDIVASAFIDGANFADAHPHWISVDDELPPTSDKDDESDDYLIVDSDGDKDVGYYNKMDELWFSCDGYILDVTHWMPLPQPPLVTDLNKKDLPPVSCQEGNILVEEEGGEKMDFFTWGKRYEYYRTKGYEQGYEDAINKSCDWFEEKACCGWIEDVEVKYFIEDFRKAMKGGEQ